MAQTATQQALDIVDRLSSARDVDGVVSELRRAGFLYGFDGFCISGIPLPGEKVDPYLLLAGWPEGWLEHYGAEDFIHVDPVVRHVKRSTMPFCWSDAPYASDDRAALRVMDDAAAIGLAAGITVPIYRTNGCQALVTFGADRLDLSAADRAAIHLFSIYAHDRARSLMDEFSGGGRRPPPRLAAREIECLKWSAAGKSAWDISVILHISQRTVEQYLASAAFKLGSVNRVQTVAEAMRHGLIN